MRLNKSLWLKSYALLAVFESALAFYFLASLPSDAQNAVFVGYSSSRLLLLAGAALPLLVFGWLAAVLASPARLERVTWLLNDFFDNRGRRLALTLISCLLMVVGIIFLLMPPNRLGDFAAFAERLAPLVYLGGALGAQTLLGKFLWRGQRLHFQNLGRSKLIFQVAAILLVLAALTAVWVSSSQIGLKPEKYGWHTPGTPIPFTQLLTALLISLPFLFLGSRAKKFELPLFLILWLAAFLVWHMEPMRRQSYFAPAPTAPNFEYYPYSDAAFYDTLSQTILIGRGESLTVILRPLYIFLLTAFHLVAGQDYNLILSLQTLLLALMPPFAFLLVSRMGGSAAGVLSALLLIFREKNSIALTNILEVSHTKLLLSDLPTMAFMLLMAYALVNWLRKKDVDFPLGIVSGAAFGLAVLMRSQTQLLLPVLLAGILFSGGFERRKALQRILVFGLGLSVVVAPWMLRNAQVTGKPVIENTGFYIRLFAGGYSEPGDVTDQLPGETFEAYNARIKSQIVRYIFNHPLEIARVYSTYFIHNEISSVVYLPMSLRLYDLHSYVRQTPFWDDPYIDLRNGYGVMFFLTLGLVALGVGTAFQRLGFLGLMPLLIHFTYSLSVVTARISGWRFVLPVDWIPQAYYSIGLVQLILMLVAVFWNRDAAAGENIVESGRPFGKRKASLALAGFLLVGLSLPLMERALPERYPALSSDELIEAHAASLGEQVTASALEHFLETEPGATVMTGRALYPSYYPQGSFWGETSPNLLAASQFNRLQFMLIGPASAFTFLPLDDAPQAFPHAADVFVVGCRQEDFVRALLVEVNGQSLPAAPWTGLTCDGAEGR